MFEWLLKHPVELFVRGSLQIDWPWWIYGASAAALATVAVALLIRRPGTGASPLSLAGRSRFTIVGALRGGLLALLLLVLLNPVLVVLVPSSKVASVAVLIDESLSMGIGDMDGKPRSAALLDLFAPGAGTVSEALETRFDVRFFGYGSHIREISSAGELSFAAARSDLAEAIEDRVSAGANSRPSAVIVVSDGQAEADLSAALSAARSRGVTVHTVGVGSERYGRDLELADVRLPGSVLREESVNAELTIRHRGYSGERVRLTVESSGVLLHDARVELPASGEPVNLTLPVTLDVSGFHRVVFAISPHPEEWVLQNNEISHTVEVSDRPLEVLHVEGEPRFEVKFLRRALAHDGNLRLVSLVRTAENKFYRLGVRDETELAGGFPESAEELFRYQALVIGSLEAAALSSEQQRLIRDFVAERGGGLLLLGGRFALAEGGYSESSLADLLPVRLEPVGGRFRAALDVRPLRAASRDPILRFDTAHVTPWNALPALTMVNPVGIAKPGATVLLQGQDEASRNWIVLAHHRYGRGRVAVLPVRDTWRWQMHSSIPADDLTHELFWRQLLRWLTRSANGRVDLTAVPVEGVPGQMLHVQLQTAGADFTPSQGQELKLSVLTPMGDIQTLDPVWSPDQAGYYEAGFVPDQAGAYELHAELFEGGRSVATDRAAVQVRGDGREYFGAELARERLRRVAALTGGQYFDLGAAAALPNAIPSRTEGEDTLRRLPLWDAPLVFLALLGLAGTEWLLRRRWGLT